MGEHICKKFPKDAVEINQDITIAIGKACGRQNVKRYIFASTCSNYGKTTIFVDETADVNPLSLYASTKINVENFLLSDECTCPVTVLRFATIYGMSSRVRFDLLIHEFIRDAWVDKEIEIYGPDGWRPFCHVDDAAKAVLTIFTQSASLERKVIYNVGSNEQNFQKKEIGELVSARLTDCKLNLRYDKGDPRSYKVNFSKIYRDTGFTCEFHPKIAIDQICTGLENGLITTENLQESVNIAADDPIRQVESGSAMKYAPVKKVSKL